jgi:hypothetical protein
MDKKLLRVFYIVLFSGITLGGFVYYKNTICTTECDGYIKDVPNKPLVNTFEECLNAGYSVMESYPRQCKTPDGRLYAEEISEKITYSNATSGMIVPILPFPGAVTGKQFLVTGKARGTWYFEASFPVEILDKNGRVLTSGPAQALSDWMTTDFVSFSATMTVPTSYIGKATVVLKKGNPSGLPEYDAFISFPITIEY